jgi:hypothetical protein
MHKINALCQYFLSRNTSTLKFIPSDVTNKRLFLDEYLTSVDYRLKEVLKESARDIFALAEKDDKEYFLKFKFDGAEKDPEYLLYVSGHTYPSELFHSLAHHAQFLVMTQTWRVMIFDETYTTERFDFSEPERALRFLEDCLCMLGSRDPMPTFFWPANVNSEFKFINAATLFDQESKFRNEWRSELSDPLASAYESLLFLASYMLFKGQKQLPWHLKPLAEQSVGKRDFDAEAFADSASPEERASEYFKGMHDKVIELATWVTSWKSHI